MNRMPKAMQLSTRAVPMSGCFRMSSPEMPSTASTGTMTIFGLRRPVGPTGQQVGGEDGQGQLHQLGRLQLEHPEPDPPGRAAGGDPEVGYQDEHQQSHGHHDQRAPDGPPLAVVHPGQRPAGHPSPRPSTAPGG